MPLPWTTAGASFGFSSEDAANFPWLPQPDWFADFAADRQTADPASVLSVYRRALRARRQIDPHSDLEWLEPGRDDVLAFRRGDLSCVTVFDGKPFEPPAAWGTLICASRTGEGPLAQGSTGWYVI